MMEVFAALNISASMMKGTRAVWVSCQPHTEITLVTSYTNRPGVAKSLLENLPSTSV